MKRRGPEDRTEYGVTPYDCSVTRRVAKFEADICRHCIFPDDCHPRRFGCALAAAKRQAAKAPVPRERIFFWRDYEYVRMTDLAEDSGADYNMLRYYRNRCETIAEAIVRAGGEKEYGK